MDKIRISTVTPVYKGADYLEELISELRVLREQFARTGDPIELCEAIFVDDDSMDESSRMLAEIEKRHDWVRVITLSRNYGQHAATMAGVLHSSGDWVITLDEDLQHPPEHIPYMLASSIMGGNDIVYANPGRGPHDAAYRNISSRVIKKLVARLSGTEHVQEFNSFRVMRGDIARAAAAVSPAEAYFDVSLTWFTNRIDARRIELHDRRSVVNSGYRVHTLLTHARRLIMASDFKLTRVGSLLGLLALGTSIFAGISLLLLALVFAEPFEVRGWLSLMLATLFFGGLIATMIGISLEFSAITYRQMQGKPAFFTIDRSKDRLLLQWAKNTLHNVDTSVRRAS